MIDRRRLLLSAAAGAGLAAAGGQVFAGTAPAGDAAAAKAALAGFMDQTFEQTLDLSPEAVTAFGLDKGPRTAAKSQLTAPTLENEFRILREAVDGGLVFQERLDRHRLKDGWVELPVTGVYLVMDGKITYWRDYFDAQTILSQWPRG